MCTKIITGGVRDVLFETLGPQELAKVRCLKTENEMLLRMSQVVAGKVVWDVGAAEGGHSIISMAYGAKAVYSFEPDREMRVALQSNLILNEIRSGVNVLPFAVWNSDTTLTLETNGREGMAPRVARNGNGTFKYKNLVDARSIDSLCQEIPVPEVLKVDVEGAETQVLLGLRNVRPEHLFLEVHLLDKEIDAYKLGRLTTDLGYELQWARERGDQLLTHFKYVPRF